MTVLSVPALSIFDLARNVKLSADCKWGNKSTLLSRQMMKSVFRITNMSDDNAALLEELDDDGDEDFATTQYILSNCKTCLNLKRLFQSTPWMFWILDLHLSLRACSCQVLCSQIWNQRIEFSCWIFPRRVARCTPFFYRFTIRELCWINVCLVSSLLLSWC